MDGEVLRPQVAQDEVQEEALGRQQLAVQTLSAQSVIEHATQNRTHFLLLARRRRVSHDAAGCDAALVEEEENKEGDLQPATRL